MQNIKMKIVGFDDESQSLLVSFASDSTNSNDPADYSPVAFQPAVMWPGVTDVEVIKRRIAQTGIGIVEQQKFKEDFDANSQLTASMASLSGTEFAFDVADLVDAPSDVTPLLVL